METIDLRPTWVKTGSMIIALLEAGSTQGKQVAKTELLKMAKLADAYVELVKEKEEEDGRSN